jgi:hypothetical protein
MCRLRHRPPVPIVSWWGPLQWVNPLQPSVRSAGQSFFSHLLCCCSSSGCNMGLLWFPSLSWWFILFSWMKSLMNGTFRWSYKVWLVTYQGAFVIIRSILDWLRCILAICDLLATCTKWKETSTRRSIIFCSHQTDELKCRAVMNMFWDIRPCGSCKSRRFGGTCRIHLPRSQQGYASRRRAKTAYCNGYIYLWNVDYY